VIRVSVKFLHRAGDLVPEDKRLITAELPEGSTLKVLLEYIRNNVSRRLALGILVKRLIFTILVNGVPAGRLEQKLKDGDSVVFLTPEMGG